MPDPSPNAASGSPSSDPRVQPAAPWGQNVAGQGDLFDRHPEIAVGGAFAGGFLFALILKKIAS
jgi:hypothetical protein